MTQHAIQSNDSIPADDLRMPPSVAHIPWWVSIIVILGALLIVTGAVISKVAPTMLTDGSLMTSAARVYADYLFARNLPIAGMLLLFLVMKNRRMLAAFMVLTALIQIVDITNDLTRGDFLIVPGLLVFAIVFLFGASQLFRRAIWHRDAWREPEHHSIES